MKTCIFLLLILFVACTPRPATVLKVDYLKLQDSIETLNVKIDSLHLENETLADSIEDLLLRPLMTSEQFLQLYKYERLNKYYRICVKNPTQWKYYKGWSIRVFEQ